MEGSDVCFAPVLDWDEAPQHPHNQARETFIDIAGVIQPAPAPRFSHSKAAAPAPPARPGEHSAAILADWGVSEAGIADLRARGVI